MRIAWIMILIVALVTLLTDGYIYTILRRRFPKKPYSKIQFWSAIALYVIVAVTLMLPRRGGPDAELLVIMWALFAYMSVLISKIIFIIFDLIASIPRLFSRGRWKLVSRVGAVIGVICFLAMWWGALINRYNIQVKEVEVNIPGLPQSLDGMRIVQLSDLHLGTFGHDGAFVDKLVARVNELHPDAVVFTGDIVNRRSEEMAPFVDELAKLKAPMGVYAILGNHDYGDYSDWPSPQAKQENMEELYRYYDEAGWRLLRNETAWLIRGRDSLAIIGVENIGDPPFPVYGDLTKAYPSISDSRPKILLSHNPAHWVMDICDNPEANIGLTLSGHTHAMQIEVLGVSPSALRYKTWGGLYKDKEGGHPLYVNIGAGTVGFPARIGATPEISVITIKR